MTGSTSNPLNSGSAKSALTSVLNCNNQRLSCSVKIRSGKVSRFAGTLALCTLNSTTRPPPLRANAAAYFKAARACGVKSVGKRIFLNGYMGMEWYTGKGEGVKGKL